MKVLFYMWEPFRDKLIKSHKFYVDQAEKRLLSHFQNIEEEAEAYAEKWLKEAEKRFNPEIDCPSEYYEQADERRVDLCLMLVDMRNKTRLSVLAGMFHEWDKKLRDWIVREGKNWGCGSSVGKAVWMGKVLDIIELLEAFGWKIKANNYFTCLDKYRIVVNAYKHGEGKAFKELKMRYPEFIQTFGEEDANKPYLRYANHTDLVVGETHLKEFSQAIIDFWNDVPEYINDTGLLSLPDWFCSAYEKDSIGLEVEQSWWKTE